jgi:hypothetical protein
LLYVRCLGDFTAQCGDREVTKDALLAALWQDVPTARAVKRMHSALLRLLRALATVDILKEGPDQEFAATATGELLQSDHSRSLRAFAINVGSPLGWQPWGNLYHSIVTGRPAFDQVYGESLFAYLGHSPRDAGEFNASMTDVSRGEGPAIVAPYDFSGLGRIVDVGGGQGALLQGILERYPRTTGSSSTFRPSSRRPATSSNRPWQIGVRWSAETCFRRWRQVAMLTS